LDTFGESKGKVIGWVVTRTSARLIKRAAIFTEKQAAKLYLKFADVQIKGGRGVAKSVALKAIPERDLLHHAGHILRNGATGLPHFQSRRIPNRHIFYTALAGIVQQTLAQPSQACEAHVSLDAIYSNPYPGDSPFHALTVSHWLPDSILSNLDWINPFELIAAGADIGRAVDREMGAELIGLVVTLKKDGEPRISYTLDSNGSLVSVARWSNGELGEPSTGEDFLRTIDGTRNLSAAVEEIKDLARPLVERGGSSGRIRALSPREIRYRDNHSLGKPKR
jgi:hypothetical protein